MNINADICKLAKNTFGKFVCSNGVDLSALRSIFKTKRVHNLFRHTINKGNKISGIQNNLQCLLLSCVQICVLSPVT
jgi:hypothetical protein